MRKRTRIKCLTRLLEALLEEADRKTRILGQVAPLCLKPVGSLEVEDQVRALLPRILKEKRR